MLQMLFLQFKLYLRLNCNLGGHTYSYVPKFPHTVTLHANTTSYEIIEMSKNII